MTAYGPDIAIEQPTDNELLNGSLTSIDFGPILAGSSSSKVFTIRNTGLASDLTDLAVTKAVTGTPGDFTISAPGATTLVPGASTTFTVTFTPSAPGTRTATLLIASNDEDENPFSFNLNGSQATASEAWRVAHFGTPYNTGTAADLRDPDGDGIVNMLEFATLNDPQVWTLPIGQIAKNGGTLEYFYRRSKAALVEVRYDLEASATISGPWGSAIQGETIVSDDGIIQQVKATYPAGITGKRFVRLRVTRH